MDGQGFIHYLEEAGINNESLKIAALFGYYSGFEDGRQYAVQEKEKKEGEKG